MAEHHGFITAITGGRLVFSTFRTTRKQAEKAAEDFRNRTGMGGVVIPAFIGFPREDNEDG